MAERRPGLYAFADEASGAVDGQIRALKRNHLDGVELRNVDGANVSDITPEKAAEVRAKLEGAGLVTWSVGSPIGKIDLLNDDFRAHLDRLKHTIDIAGALGARCIRVFSFYTPAGDDPTRYRDEVFERLERMLELSRGTGIALCHENEKGIYGDVAARCLEIHQAFPELAAVFDPANFVQCGQDTAEAWALLGPRVRYLHVKDALADGSVVPAGYGEGHVADILADYLSGGGDALTVEPHLTVFEGLSVLERGERRAGPFAYESRDAAFDAACAALRELLARRPER